MSEQIFGEITLRHILFALLIFGGFIGLAWLFRVFLGRVVKRLAQKTKTRLDDLILSAIKKPVVAIIIMAGGYLSVLYLPLAPTPHLYLSKGLSIVLSLLGIYTGVALISVVMRWYGQEVKEKKREVGLTIGILGFFRVVMLMFAVFLAVLVTVQIIGIEATTVTGWMGEHGWRIVLIVILFMTAIIAIGELVPRLVARSIARRSGESEEEVGKRGYTLSRVLTNSGQALIILIATFTILSELDINIAPILAGAGVAGIAIGFGAQNIIRDILAGVFILMENQYHRVGDVVRIADVAGLVEDINLRRTVLRDLDGIVHVVPNGEIRVASNFTKDWSRVNLNVSVAYGEDLDRVISVINRVGKELAEDIKWAPLILTPPQVLRVDNLGDSGIEIKILGETKPIRQWDVMGELRRRLKKAFDEEGIEIPWPHTKVYFGSSPYSRDNQSSRQGKRN